MTVSVGISLPMPDDLIPDVNTMYMISPSIKLTLQRIAQFTAMARRRIFYLAKSTTLNKLLDYHASNCISHHCIYDATAPGQGKTPSGGDQKIPAFSVPKFVSDSLEG